VERRQGDVTLEVLAERVENWIKGTDDFRKEMRKEFKEVKDAINSFPCDERKEKTKSISFQLNIFWWIVAILVPSVFGLAVAWGSLNKQVEVNTQRWEKVLDEPSRIRA